jgi:hypothetical protein
MRRYPELEHEIMALVHSQPFCSARFIVKSLTDRGHCSTQAVKSSLRALEFEGKITNVGGESAVWKVTK